MQEKNSPQIGKEPRITKGGSAATERDPPKDAKGKAFCPRNTRLRRGYGVAGRETCGER